MTKQEKLLEKAKRNPEGLSFYDIQNFKKQKGLIFDHQKGSHQIWYSPKSYRISVQNRNGKAKGYQVKQFLTRLEEENGNAE